MAQVLGCFFAFSVLFQTAGAACTEANLKECTQSTCDALPKFADGLKASWCSKCNPSDGPKCKKCGGGDNIYNCHSKAVCENITYSSDPKHGTGVGSWNHDACRQCGDCMNKSQAIPDCNPFSGCSREICEKYKLDNEVRGSINSIFLNWADSSCKKCGAKMVKMDGSIVAKVNGQHRTNACSSSSCKLLKFTEPDMINTINKWGCSKCNKSEPSNCGQETCENITWPDGRWIPTWKGKSCQRCSRGKFLHRGYGTQVSMLGGCNQTTCAKVKFPQGVTASTTYDDANGCRVCGENSVEGCNTKELCDKVIVSGKVTREHQGAPWQDCKEDSETVCVEGGTRGVWKDHDNNNKPWCKRAPPATTTLAPTTRAPTTPPTTRAPTTTSTKKSTTRAPTNEAPKTGASGTTAAPKTATPIEITGGLTMEVPDAQAFLTDEAAKEGVKEGIASAHSTSAHKILASRVKLTVTESGTRRLAASDRRLVGKVNVMYTITISADSSAQAAATKAAENVTTEQLTTFVQEKVTAKKGAGFKIKVTDKTKAVVKSAAATTAGVSRGSANGATSDLLSNLATALMIVVGSYELA